MIENLTFCKSCRTYVVAHKHSLIACTLRYVESTLFRNSIERQINKAFFPCSEIEIDGNIFFNPII